MIQVFRHTRSRLITNRSRYAPVRCNLQSSEYIRMLGDTTSTPGSPPPGLTPVGLLCRWGAQSQGRNVMRTSHNTKLVPAHEDGHR